MASPFDRRLGSDGNPLGFGLGREFGAPAAGELPQRRLRKAVAGRSSPSPAHSYGELVGPPDDRPLPAILRRAFAADPGPLVSPMRGSAARSPRAPDEEVVRTQALSTEVPPHVLQHILAAVGHVVEARLAVESRAREALSSEVATLESRIGTLSHGMSALRSSAVTQESLLALQGAVRSEVAGSEVRLREELRDAMNASRLAAVARHDDAVGSSAPMSTFALENLAARMDAVSREFQDSVQHVQHTLQARLLDLRSELESERAARVAGEDALSSRINAMARQVSDVQAPGLPFHSPASPGQPSNRIKAPYDTSAPGGDAGVIEDGHEGPRLITRNAADAIATGLRASLEAETQERRAAQAAQEAAMRSALAQAQADITDALERVQSMFQQRLEGAVTAVSTGVADVADRVRVLTVAAHGTASQLTDVQRALHDHIASTQQALVRVVEQGRRDVRHASQKWEQHEQAMADALLRGLRQEAHARDVQLNELAMQLQSGTHGAVQDGISKLESAVSRIRSEVLHVSDQAKAAHSLAESSHAQVGDVMRAQLESLRMAHAAEVRSLRDHVAAVQASVAQQVEDAQLTIFAALDSKLLEHGEHVAVQLRALDPRLQEQTAVLQNLDNVVAELTKGLTSHAATLEQHDKTLSEIVDGSVSQLLVAQTERVADMGAQLQRVQNSLQEVQQQVEMLRVSAGASEAAAIQESTIDDHAARLLNLEQTFQEVQARFQQEMAVFRNMDTSLAEVSEALTAQGQRFEGVDHSVTLLTAWQRQCQDALHPELQQAAHAHASRLAEVRSAIDDTRATLQALSTSSASRIAELDFRVQELQVMLKHGPLHSAAAPAEASSTDTKAQLDAHASYISILRGQVATLSKDLGDMKLTGATGVASGSADGSDGLDTARQRLERIVEQHTEMLGDVCTQSDLQMMQDGVHTALRAVQDRVEHGLQQDAVARNELREQLMIMLRQESGARDQELDDLAAEIRDHVAEQIDRVFQRCAAVTEDRVEGVSAMHSALQVDLEVGRCVDYLVNTVADAFLPDIAAAAAAAVISEAGPTSPNAATPLRTFSTSFLDRGTPLPASGVADRIIRTASSHASLHAARGASRVANNSSPGSQLHDVRGAQSESLGGPDADSSTHDGPEAQATPTLPSSQDTELI